MNTLAAGLASLLLAATLSACDQIHGVSSAKSTNLEGSPGTANDLTTGGQGGNNHPDSHP